ncbi:MAG TPA: hypothetical protein VFA43_25265 [Gemmatimonadaceae bacterium]|nr:hypothetical protein [Gemmatimonadaceae bacterium]
MKQQIIDALVTQRRDLEALRKTVRDIPGEQVGRKEPRQFADAIATRWVETLRSPLEHKFKLPSTVIKDVSDGMKRLHVLSRPNNLKKSYLDTIKRLLYKYDDRLILPLKQSAGEITSLLDLQKLIPGLKPEQSEYLTEAVNCAGAGYRRASIVLGWCATIDQIQRKFLLLGLDQVNKTSIKLKAQTSGKYKRWNKEFGVTTLAELQTIFDSDLVVLAEGLELIDGNEAERLETCFQYRNHSAHPGQAPVEDAHLLAFFTDISKIVLQNPKFAL